MRNLIDDDDLKSLLFLKKILINASNAEIEQI